MKNLFLIIIILLFSCKKDSKTTQVLFKFPTQFSTPIVPDDNPTTLEGVLLGKKLFFETLLSGDNTMSCASCHHQEYGFTDQNRAFSEGINKQFGNRNSMALINLAWGQHFFWDGRSSSLEQQALEPVINPIEMNETWENAVKEINKISEYKVAFNNVFGTSTITKELIAKAIAQYERTLISTNSIFETNYPTINSIRDAMKNPTNSLERGISIFYGKGDCFHCHGGMGNYLFTDLEFHNNGLDTVYSDLGLGGIDHNVSHNGFFKSPTLKNIELTAPYMHDGRFKTLEEVVEHYHNGVKNSPNLDPDMLNLIQGNNFTQQEKEDIITFLKSLTDITFIKNKAYQK